MEDYSGHDVIRLDAVGLKALVQPWIGQASTALGSTPWRNLFRHILPNSLAPIIVVGTTSLATYIVLEATLSFLGVGLPTTTVSWGGDISNAQSILRTDPMVLFYPSAALAITVLAFIMMGDAVKDALDPKSRT